MTRTFFLIHGWALLLVASLASTAAAAKPWDRLVPFKRVESDAAKEYALTEDHGPWMILATSFAGSGAEEQAKRLVLELREQFNVEAYAHKRAYDFTEPVVGLGVDQYGGPKKMRYAHAGRFEEIAVLVGNYNSVEDPNVEKALEKIRYARPECLNVNKQEGTSQRFFGLRELHRRLSPDEEKRQRGPMGNAFVTRNPLLPEEFFAPKGLDPLVRHMNQGVDYSLLDNPGKYTVRIATFRGSSTMKVAEIEREGRALPSKLETAAIKAHDLTEALRKQGVEAYEFHDRFESIVTVGSFEVIGKPLPDGRTEMHPEILAIVRKYGAQRQPLPGQDEFGLVPVSIQGIPCDVQPWPVMVPRVSLAAAIAPGRRSYE